MLQNRKIKRTNILPHSLYNPPTKFWRQLLSHFLAVSYTPARRPPQIHRSHAAAQCDSPGTWVPAKPSMFSEELKRQIKQLHYGHADKHVGGNLQPAAGNLGVLHQVI